MLFTLIYEIGQFRVFDIQGIEFLTKLINKSQLGVLIRFQETDVKTDHFNPILRQDVHKSSELRPGPRPAPFRIEALFIYQRHNDRRRRPQMATRQEAEVIGFQFDHVEDGDA